MGEIDRLDPVSLARIHKHPAQYSVNYTRNKSFLISFKHCGYYILTDSSILTWVTNVKTPATLYLLGDYRWIEGNQVEFSWIYQLQSEWCTSIHLLDNIKYRSWIPLTQLSKGFEQSHHYYFSHHDHFLEWDPDLHHPSLTFMNRILTPIFNGSSPLYSTHRQNLPNTICKPWFDNAYSRWLRIPSLEIEARIRNPTKQQYETCLLSLQQLSYLHQQSISCRDTYYSDGYRSRIMSTHLPDESDRIYYQKLSRVGYQDIVLVSGLTIRIASKYEYPVSREDLPLEIQCIREKHGHRFTRKGYWYIDINIVTTNNTHISYELELELIRPTSPPTPSFVFKQLIWSSLKYLLISPDSDWSYITN